MSRYDLLATIVLSSFMIRINENAKLPLSLSVERVNLNFN
jgi:hypothetical protein